MGNKVMSAGRLLKQANQLKRMGKLDEAIALYHQVIEINPHFAWAYHNLGDALVKQGNLDEGVVCYSEGLKINPNSALLLYSLGDALAKIGDLETAAKYLKKAIELKPDYDNFQKRLSKVLSQKESLFKQNNSIVISKYAINFLMSNLSNLWDNKFLEKNYLQFLFDYQRLGLYQSGELLAECTEAKTYKKSNIVIKEYKSIYYSFNDKFNRKSEGYYLKKYRSICFIELLQESPLFIIMPYAGEPIGIIDENMPGQRRINLQGLDYLALVKWLVYLQKELNRLKIQHRDINPTNILYNKQKNEYKLIDFCWTLEEGEPDDVNSKPSCLNPYAENDNQAIERLTIFAIKELINLIGSEGYRDGSSTEKGWVYHPLPFPEFEDIPVHKKAATNELKEIIKYSQVDFSQQPRILEIGSAVGYFSFNLARLGAEVVAFEADSFAYRVAEALRVYKRFENIKFINQNFSQEVLTQFYKYFDLVIMLNVHMWIHKQLGESATKELMKLLAQKTRKIAFQTAHAESGGMYTIKSLKDKNDIYNYLIECGFKNVQYIRETTEHGGKRILFICDGNIDNCPSEAIAFIGKVNDSLEHSSSETNKYTITATIISCSQDDPEALWGFNVDRVQQTNTSNSNGIKLMLLGWVLGKKSKVEAIEIIYNHVVVKQVLIDFPRPDVAQVYSHLPDAEMSGFETIVDIGELVEEGELLIQAVCSNKSCILLKKVQFQVVAVEKQ